MIRFIPLVLFDTCHCFMHFLRAKDLPWGRNCFIKRKDLQEGQCSGGEKEKITAKSPQGFNKYLWSIFSLITTTSYQRPVSCYLKCQRELFLGLEGTLCGKNERVIQMWLPQRQTRPERKHQFKGRSTNPKNSEQTGGWVTHPTRAAFLLNGTHASHACFTVKDNAADKPNSIRGQVSLLCVVVETASSREWGLSTLLHKVSPLGSSKPRGFLQFLKRLWKKASVVKNKSLVLTW